MSNAINSMQAWLDEKLSSLMASNRFRVLNPIEPLSAVHGRLCGKQIILFSSNDYLGLSHHPQVRKSMAQAAMKYGSGPRGSPLICGYTTVHQELETELADLCGKERALLFPSGYAANLGVITTFGEAGTELFSDEFNHASIVDACRIARQNGARVHVFRHCDVNHLESLLQKHASKQRVIITESVFSTQGDHAPLTAICELKNRYDAWLVTDEGHAVLVFGKQGGGLAEQMGVSEQVDVQVGTLSKAAAFQGGFAACGHALADLILNQSRSLIFSTASPIPVVAGLLAGIRLARTDCSPKESLWRHVALLSKRLGRKCKSPIMPIVLGDEKTTLQASQALIDRGAHVIGLRPPTVPTDTCRLRITLSAAHTESDLIWLLDTMQELGLIQTADYD